MKIVSLPPRRVFFVAEPVRLSESASRALMSLAVRGAPAVDDALRLFAVDREGRVLLLPFPKVGDDAVLYAR